MKILVTIPQIQPFLSFLSPDNQDELEKLGQVSYNELGRQFTKQELCSRITDTELLITGWSCPRIDEEVVDCAKHLRYIAHTGGSVGALICKAVYDRGIRVLSGNELFAQSVAEGIIGYLLFALRNLDHFYQGLNRHREWLTQDMGRSITRGLMGKTVGIVSYGTISKYLIPLLHAFGARIHLYSRKRLPTALLQQYRIVQSDLPALFEQCDIVSLQTALNEYTVSMIDKNLLQRLRPGSIFVNTARGALVCEHDLLEEIEKRRIFFILDTFVHEPLPPDSPLFGHENVMLMPHCAGPAVDMRSQITAALIHDIDRHLSGQKLSLEIPWERAREMTVNA